MLPFIGEEFVLSVEKCGVWRNLSGSRFARIWSVQVLQIGLS